MVIDRLYINLLTAILDIINNFLLCWPSSDAETRFYGFQLFNLHALHGERHTNSKTHHPEVFPRELAANFFPALPDFLPPHRLPCCHSCDTAPGEAG